MQYPDPRTISHEETAKIVETAQRAASAGGEVLMRCFREGVSTRFKSDDGDATYNLVSDADIDSEKVIGELITDAFPGHRLLGEETLGRGIDPAACEHLWVIDPLDGTNNFAHRIPQFAVSIAYYRDGRPVVGVIDNPATGDRFQATVGGGAWHNGSAVRVSSEETLDRCLIGCGFYYDRGEMMRATLRTIESFFGRSIHGIRRFGAAALDLCMVGCGQFGGFFEYQLSPWDFAAGRLFVEEAGGQVTAADGCELQLSPSSIVASNGRIHQAMLAVTRTHLVDPSAEQ